MEYIVKFYGTDWAAMVLTFISLHYLGNRSIWGFVFGILASLAWMGFGLLAGSLANPIANAIFILLNIRGIVKWRKDSKTAEANT